MKKILPRGLMALYFLILIWLVLFKFSHHISSVLNYQHRSLNLIPFAASKIVNGRVSLGEIIYNCIFFIPLGVLLNLNFKKGGFFPKLTFIFVFSFTLEIIQYILAIGATDVTDLITNTVGGFIGLKLYDLGHRYINSRKLDNAIVATGALLLILFISMHASHLFLR